MNVERGSNWVTISSSPSEAAVVAHRVLWSVRPIFVVLLPVCALLYVYWVPLTSSPVRDADGNPRFR